MRLSYIVQVGPMSDDKYSTEILKGKRRAGQGKTGRRWKDSLLELQRDHGPANILLSYTGLQNYDQGFVLCLEICTVALGNYKYKIISNNLCQEKNTGNEVGYEMGAALGSRIWQAH